MRNSLRTWTRSWCENTTPSGACIMDESSWKSMVSTIGSTSTGEQRMRQYSVGKTEPLACPSLMHWCESWRQLAIWATAVEWLLLAILDKTWNKIGGSVRTISKRHSSIMTSSQTLVDGHWLPAFRIASTHSTWCLNRTDLTKKVSSSSNGYPSLTQFQAHTFTVLGTCQKKCKQTAGCKSPTSTLISKPLTTPNQSSVRSMRTAMQQNKGRVQKEIKGTPSQKL